jgi:hypothetical protein
MVKHGFYHTTDSEVIYLARVNKLELSKFKLVKYDMTSNTQGTQIWITNIEIFPTASDEYLEFKDVDVFGFTMRSYPTIDGVIVAEINNEKVKY